MALTRKTGRVGRGKNFACDDPMEAVKDSGKPSGPKSASGGGVTGKPFPERKRGDPRQVSDAPRQGEQGRQLAVRER
ncbi:MAG TPA: hypothetical protein PL064_04620 [Thermogutta sp.]|nr:hypothetical protein [Thermogutta sp.]HPZ82691.1 hypothetical protein [Thermogutta sp.]